MDVTILTMLPERGGAADFDGLVAEYRHLCIIQVLPHQPVGEVHSPRTGLVHVTGVSSKAHHARLADMPGKSLFDKMKALEEVWTEPVFATAVPSKQNVQKRAWSLDPKALSNDEKRALMKLRQVTISADRFFAALRYKEAF